MAYYMDFLKIEMILTVSNYNIEKGKKVKVI